MCGILVLMMCEKKGGTMTITKSFEVLYYVRVEEKYPDPHFQNHYENSPMFKTREEATKWYDSYEMPRGACYVKSIHEYHKEIKE